MFCTFWIRLDHPQHDDVFLFSVQQIQNKDAEFSDLIFSIVAIVKFASRWLLIADIFFDCMALDKLSVSA